VYWYAYVPNHLKTGQMFHMKLDASTDFGQFHPCNSPALFSTLKHNNSWCSTNNVCTDSNVNLICMQSTRMYFFCLSLVYMVWWTCKPSSILTSIKTLFKLKESDHVCNTGPNFSESHHICCVDCCKWLKQCWTRLKPDINIHNLKMKPLWRFKLFSNTSFLF
jgi:hypothetical protein